MQNVIKSIYEKMIELDDATEIAETFFQIDYSSEWDADKFLNEFNDALDAELEARADACN